MPLNTSKGNMYPFITHTFNTVKGECYHNCSYCHPAGTMILMGDFSLKDISEVQIGDEIVGLEKENNIGYYKFVKSRVVDVSKRTSETLAFQTEDDYIRCTPEHPLMGSTQARNCSDWKIARSFSPYQNIRYIPVKSREWFMMHQREGYLAGVCDGDGCVFEYGNQYSDKRKYKGFEIVCIDSPMRDRIKNELLEIIGVNLSEGIKRASKNGWGGDCPMLYTRKTRDIAKIEEVTKFRVDNPYFARGYLAGMIDTDGSVSGGSIRIAQSKLVNRKKYDKILYCCKLLGLDYVEEVDVIRIKSNFDFRCQLIFEYGIFNSSKIESLLLGYTVKGSRHSMIKSIHAYGEETVYNLQTECENFIANGFIVHNCYMKRWGSLNPVRFDKSEFKTDLGKGNFIFVGSSCDMFSEKIPDDWIYLTMRHCLKYPENKYLFQSKNPYRIPGFLYPQMNAVMCTTIETNRHYPEIMGNSPQPRIRAFQMMLADDSVPFKLTKHVTIEPIMKFDIDALVEMILSVNPEQVNIGADSGNNHLPEPKEWQIADLVNALEPHTNVILKKNLKRLSPILF